MTASVPGLTSLCIATTSSLLSLFKTNNVIGDTFSSNLCSSYGLVSSKSGIDWMVS